MGRHLHSVSVGSPEAVPGRIRVVLADDHPSLRRALRQLLEQETDLQVVAEATDLESAVRQVRKHRPEVLVLDLRMPNGSSAERIRRMRERSPVTQIVVISMEQNQLFAERARQAGAIGFVLKDTADTELCNAVRDAARHVCYESPRLRKR